MRNHAWRALLLAVAILIIGALPALAQSGDKALPGDDGSVLVGIQNDVTLPAGSEADAVIVVGSSALIEGVAKGLVAIDSDVTITGTGAAVDSVFVVGGTLNVTNGATVTDVAYCGHHDRRGDPGRRDESVGETSRPTSPASVASSSLPLPSSCSSSSSAGC